MPQAEFAKRLESSSSMPEVRRSLSYLTQAETSAARDLDQASELVEREDSPEQVDGFMAHLLQCLGNDAFQLWFGPQTRVRLQGTHLVVEASSDFLVDCIKNFCQPDLNNAVRQYFGQEYSIRLASVRTAQDQNSTLRKPNNSPSAAAPRIETPASKAPTASTSVGVGAAHRPEKLHKASPQLSATAESPRAAKPADGHASEQASKAVPPFFIGKSNRMAAAAVDMIVDKPGELGLLFVFGPNGVGKTHLCKSLRERLRQRHSLRRVMYMTAEQFTIDFSESTRGAGFAAFRKKYRDVEGLIIDDAQFFLGKNQTLAELRNTIDDLLGRRRQIVLTADRPLSELVGMGSDLHARLSGGVSCCLELLDPALRRSLLEDICRRHHVDLSQSTLDALAMRSTGDGRSLYGLVFRLLTQQRVAGTSLTHEQAMSCTYDLLQANQPVLRLPDIERVVCDSFGLEPKALRAKNRSKSVTAARMLAMFLARKHTSAAYSEIGQYFGNRQHSTVISAHKRVENWLTSDEPLSHRTGTVSIREWVRNAEANLRVG